MCIRIIRSPGIAPYGDARLRSRNSVTPGCIASWEPRGGDLPLIDALVSIARTRQVGFLGIISLTFIVVGAVTSLLSGDARCTLAKSSFLTGVFGLVFFATRVIGTPLMFSFGRQFAIGGNPEKIAY